MAEVIPSVCVSVITECKKSAPSANKATGLLGSDYPGPVSDDIIHSISVQCKDINRKLFFDIIKNMFVV